MSESKHTPGPWSIEPHPERPDLPIRVMGGKGERVARCSQISLCTTPEECKANARLISAAPDLLEALVMVRDADNDCIADGLQTIPPTPRAKIDAAIAKAKGTQ
jgi:hypothetical protein